MCLDGFHRLDWWRVLWRRAGIGGVFPGLMREWRRGAGVQNFREGGGLGGFARSGSEVKVRRRGDGVEVEEDGGRDWKGREAVYMLWVIGDLVGLRLGKTV
jgi:hypothetical protein